MAPGFLPSLESLLQSQTNHACLSCERHMGRPGQAGPRTPAPQVSEDGKAGPRWTPLTRGRAWAARLAPSSLSPCLAGAVASVAGRARALALGVCLRFPPAAGGSGYSSLIN